jgi:predicted O-methyltransferase YrrM
MLTAPDRDSLLEALGLRPQVGGALLDALVAAGFLIEEDGALRPADEVHQALIGEYPDFVRHQLRLERRRTMDRWYQLRALLYADSPEELPFEQTSYVDYLRTDSAEARRFSRMMLWLHQEDAERLARQVDLSGRRRLLDVGGGPGVYSIAFCRANAQLQAVVLDLPYVCAAGQDVVAEAGLSDRIQCVAGEFSGPWPQGFDALLMADIGGARPWLIEKAFAALNPGGLLIIKDVFLDDPSRRKSVTWALDRLSRLAVFETEEPLTIEEGKAALEAAGFEGMDVTREREDWYLVLAHKPPAKS